MRYEKYYLYSFTQLNDGKENIFAVRILNKLQQKPKNELHNHQHHVGKMERQKKNEISSCTFCRHYAIFPSNVLYSVYGSNLARPCKKKIKIIYIVFVCYCIVCLLASGFGFVLKLYLARAITVKYITEYFECTTASKHLLNTAYVQKYIDFICNRFFDHILIQKQKKGRNGSVFLYV